MYLRSIVALLLISSACAQVKITQGPVVDAITYSTARLTWYTSAAASTYIRYGIDSLNLRTDRTAGGLRTVHSFFLSGLASNTTYRYQTCSVAADKSEACADPQTFTTAAATGTTPLTPEPPQQFVDVTMPTGFGDALAINDQCSNISTVLTNLAALEGDLNYEVTIPAGTVCAGIFTFPHRPKHNGWVIVRTTGSLPPEGTRVDASVLPQMARIVTDAIPEGIRYTVNAASTSCYPGQLWWAYDVPGMGLFVCSPQGPSGGAKSLFNAYIGGFNAVVIGVASHGYKTGNIVRIAGTGLGVDNANWKITVIDENNFILDGSRGRGTYSGTGTATRNDSWTQVAHRSGTELPAECAVNDWFFRTDLQPATDAAYWCTSPNTWGRRRAINAGQVEAIQFQENARRYRFIGLEITPAPVPSPHPEGWDKPFYVQGSYSALIRSNPSNDSVIFDRCDIHGLDYPNRLGRGIYLNGSNVAVINSRVYGVNRWTVKPDGALLEATAIDVIGPGPGLIDNNFLEAIGITIFFPDQSRNGLPPTDFVIRRNFFSHPDRYLMGAEANTSGKNYMNRQLIELKAGQRFLIEGNVFNQNWADITTGAMIVLTPRATAVAPAKTISKIENGTVTLVNNAANLTYPYTPGQLVTITNAGALNGIWPIDSILSPTSFTLRDAPSGTIAGGLVEAATSNMQVSDIDVKNNVFRRTAHLAIIAGHHDVGIGSYMTRTTQRVRFLNNLIYDINARRYSQGGYVSPIGVGVNGRTGIAFSVDAGCEDVIIQNNTVFDVKGASPHLIFTDITTTGPNSGLDLRDNVVTGERLTLYSVSGQLPGTDSLNRQFVSGSQPSWNIINNILCCNLIGGSAKTPPNNFLPGSLSEIGVMDADGLRFQLTGSSPFRGRGTGGSDPGVNIADLEAALGQSLTALLGPTPP